MSKSTERTAVIAGVIVIIGGLLVASLAAPYAIESRLKSEMARTESEFSRKLDGDFELARVSPSVTNQLVEITMAAWKARNEELQRNARMLLVAVLAVRMLVGAAVAGLVVRWLWRLGHRGVAKTGSSEKIA